jgi:DNA-binding response OmpR family regulator
MKSKSRILLVDDDTDMTETLSDILQEKNFQVEMKRSRRSRLLRLISF